MTVPTDLLLVSAVGLITGLATGLGVLPFFVVDEIGDRAIVVLWGLAVGILLSVSVFGLVGEGLTEGDPHSVGLGFAAGVAFVLAADRLVASVEFGPGATGAVDPSTLVLTVGVLTLHSLPEGIAVGVAFADLGLDGEGTLSLLGWEIPALAVFVSVAVSILNVPEGLAIAIPLVAAGIAKWKVVGWAVFSGLPQPIGAALAYTFVTSVETLLPLSFGFAAGALVYLVLVEFLPAGVEYGSGLPRRGRPELIGGIGVGLVTMIGLLVLVG
ncbi:ZIP family metal transporter [Natronorarus salvus]|uniref:ZIP family metal transporter n=1 Tax=Natronorarus salvus TaxID=3117733 RepID=UPI002F260820